MIEDFFNNLSQRMRSENDLSDITWAMTQTSNRFLSEFLRFFFPKVRFGKVDLIREYTERENRPDFYEEGEGVVWFDFTQNSRLNKLINPNLQIKLLKSFF